MGTDKLLFNGEKFHVYKFDEEDESVTYSFYDDKCLMEFIVCKNGDIIFPKVGGRVNSRFANLFSAFLEYTLTFGDSIKYSIKNGQ